MALISLEWAIPSVTAADIGSDLSAPELARHNMHVDLVSVGSGNYRKWGFKIYHATLWAAAKPWEAERPYALELRYARELSKETLAEAVMDDIRAQNVADEQTYSRWGRKLNDVLPSVNDNDTITAITMPGKKSRLYFNGKEIANFDDDMALSKAFFNIWLGANADEDLREELLGREG